MKTGFFMFFRFICSAGACRTGIDLPGACRTASRTGIDLPGACRTGSDDLWEYTFENTG